MQRHDLVYLQPHEPYDFMNASLPLSVTMAVDKMIESQQPLTACRQDVNDVIKVATSYIEDGRKYRLALTLSKTPEIIKPPLALEVLVPQLPKAIQRPTQQFIERCAYLNCDVRVYGSFANQYFTSLPFVKPTSDLDILIVAHSNNISQILLAVEAFNLLAQSAVGLKIDGEIRLHGCNDVSFNELIYAIMFDVPTVLVKTLCDIKLQKIDVLLGWNTDEFEHFIRSNKQTFIAHTGSLAAD